MTGPIPPDPETTTKRTISWGGESSGNDSSPRYPRVSVAVSLLLILVGVAAVAGIVLNISNYGRSLESAGGLDLEFNEIVVSDDGNPRARLLFLLSNHSPIPLGIEQYGFTLYANGQRIGSSGSSYRGTAPDPNDTSTRDATFIRQVIPPDDHLDIEFTLYIYSTQMEIVRDAQREGPIAWSVTAGFQTRSSYSSRIETVGLDATHEE